MSCCKPNDLDRVKLEPVPMEQSFLLEAFPEGLSFIEEAAAKIDTSALQVSRYANGEVQVLKYAYEPNLYCCGSFSGKMGRKGDTVFLVAEYQKEHYAQYRLHDFGSSHQAYLFSLEQAKLPAAPVYVFKRIAPVPLRAREAIGACSDSIGKGNVLINIQGAGRFFQLDDLNMGNHNWDYVSADGLKDARPWLESYLKKHALTRFQNVAIIAYGQGDELGLYPSISPGDLARYRQDSSSGEIADNIKTLIWLCSKINSSGGLDGNLFFLGYCAKDTIGAGIGAALQHLLHDAQGLDGLSLFFSILPARRYAGEDFKSFKLVWGKPVTAYGREYIHHGWHRYQKSGYDFIDQDLIINKSGNPVQFYKIKLTQ